jgi:hypothetical protein
MDKKNVDPQFSIEMISSEYIRLNSLNGRRTHIQGSLGELKEINLVEGVFLEIKGKYGILSVDVDEEDLKKLLEKEVK